MTETEYTEHIVKIQDDPEYAGLWFEADKVESEKRQRTAEQLAQARHDKLAAEFAELAEKQFPPAFTETTPAPDAGATGTGAATSDPTALGGGGLWDADAIEALKRAHLPGYAERKDTETMNAKMAQVFGPTVAEKEFLDAAAKGMDKALEEKEKEQQRQELPPKEAQALAAKEFAEIMEKGFKG